MNQERVIKLVTAELPQSRHDPVTRRLRPAPDGEGFTLDFGLVPVEKSVSNDAPAWLSGPGSYDAPARVRYPRIERGQKINELLTAF